MNSIDLYKYLAEFTVGSVSMSLVDYLLYSSSMNQAAYSGMLFGTSVAGVCYLVDWIMVNNSINYIAKPVISTIVYMWMY